MVHKENKNKILELFFDFPTRRFQLREISRDAGIAVTSVKKYLDKFVSQKIILKKNEGVYPYFISNRECYLFKFSKKINLIERLNQGGILEYIEEKCFPKSVILFGSASLGEDIETSDIDLFIEAREQKLDLSKFEKKLNRKINIFFEKDFSRLNKELKNNILNGFKLYGYIEVFK